MTYTANIEFKATKLTPHIHDIEPWLWGYAMIGKDVSGGWVLATCNSVNGLYDGELPFNWEEYVVLENDRLVIYPADAFHAKFTEVKEDE